VHCAPLFCISVDTIEKLSPYLCDTRLAEILSERYIANPELSVPFFLSHNSALSLKGLNRVPTLLQVIGEELRGVVAAFEHLESAPATE
jgi:hypothetical protein